MIVVMEKGASRDQIDHMVERIEGLGLKAHVIVGAERTVIAAIGEKLAVRVPDGADDPEAPAPGHSR